MHLYNGKCDVRQLRFRTEQHFFFFSLTTFFKMVVHNIICNTKIMQGF